MKNNFFIQKGFTIIELVVVIAIIAVLSTIIIANISGIREKSNIAVAGATQREMTKAVDLYFSDMGFYPPDVNRGWDPGLTRPPAGTQPGTPWSPDAPSSGSFSTSGATCTDCPSDWQDVILRNWRGPYLSQWPQFTPWGGKYDYNYWSVDTNRGGCTVPPGIYMGVEKNYDDISGAIPADSEIKMGQAGFDSNCPNNGEAQMLLKPL
jgi:prepilin-type N-terminal cleavage/methylation domain-containing protein